MNSSVFALDLISKLVESRCWQDSSVEHKSEDAQVRMSERLRQVSKFSLNVPLPSSLLFFLFLFLHYNKRSKDE